MPPSPDPLPRRLVYLPVEHEDDEQRHVEGGAGGEDLVADILTDQTALLDVDAVQVVRVLPAELRCQGHHQGHRPHNHNHGDDTSSVTCVDVVNVGDCPVPVTYETVVV